jgi:hypothetical protein
VATFNQVDVCRPRRSSSSIMVWLG